MKNIIIVIIANINFVNSFKLSLQNTMISHLLGQSLKKKIYLEILNDSDIMKHIVDNHIDTLYILILSCTVINVIVDKNRLDLIMPYKSKKILPTFKRFELLILVIIYVLCKNIENAI